MNKKLGTIGLVFIFICVGLSGCDEFEEDDSNASGSIPVTVEAIAQVVNKSGEPVENVSVCFSVGLDGDYYTTIVRVTDSTGWTPFAVSSFTLPLNGEGAVTVGIQGTFIMELYSLEYEHANANKVNNAYYWSISCRLVQD